MKKLQQFKVWSFRNEELRGGGVIEDERGAELRGHVVALGDNEMLRAIRRICGRHFSRLGYEGLLAERDELMKRKGSAGCKARLRAINEELRAMVFIPEIVSVESRRESSYLKLAREGFKLNGVKYVRFMCGAGHARTNRTLFVDERIFDELDEVLRCGVGRDVVVAPSKWNAYYALTSSATYQVSEPRVCVVADREIEMAKTVDWIEHDDESGEDRIERVEKELSFNLWDGMGLISPEFAQRWAIDLELDYLPSAFVLRNAFCKGLVATFDFHRFAREVAHSDELTDIWGEKYHCDDIDIILTQSQFKLWSAYKSWGQYLEGVHKSGLSWGVSKVAADPRLEKSVVFTNYQFLQVLNFDDEKLKGFCDYTVDWFKDVLGGDTKALVIYLLGKAARNKSARDVWDRISDPFVKAILLEKELARDSYIRERISRSLEKRMRLSKMGKLITKGNFQFMIADPYGLAQHAFGMEVTGLLKEHEHYSAYWNSKGAGQVVAERAPLTWRSEVNILNLQDSEEMRDWYQYTTSGIIYNVWGVDCMLAADSDFDGDIVYTTNNEYMLKGVYEDTKGIPITYKPSKIQKVTLNYDDLKKFDAFAYNTKIGYITNCSTTLYEMQHLYEEGSAEFKEIETRLKLCRKAQGMEIDKAKIGAKVPSLPQKWVRREVGGDEFTNKLVIEKRPYFMRYLYSQYNQEYKQHVADFNRYSIVMFGVPYAEISEEIKTTDEYKELKEYYDRKCPLLETDGLMNRMCRYMETALADVKKTTKALKTEDSYNILFTGYGVDRQKLKQMLELYNQYKNFKKAKMLSESEFNTYEQFYKSLRQKALEEITNDKEELANLAVEISYNTKGTTKEFCWDVFGNWMVYNIMNKKKENGDEIVEVPVMSEFGDFEYLGDKYGINAFNFAYSDDATEDEEDEFDSLLGDIDEDDLFEDLE